LSYQLFCESIKNSIIHLIPLMIKLFFELHPALDGGAILKSEIVSGLVKTEMMLQNSMSS